MQYNILALSCGGRAQRVAAAVWLFSRRPILTVLRRTLLVETGIEPIGEAVSFSIREDRLQRERPLTFRTPTDYFSDWWFSNGTLFVLDDYNDRMNLYRVNWCTETQFNDSTRVLYSYAIYFSEERLAFYQLSAEHTQNTSPAETTCTLRSKYNAARFRFITLLFTITISA